MTEGNNKQQSSPSDSFESKYNSIANKSRELQIEQQMLIDKALKGDNPQDIVKKKCTYYLGKVFSQVEQ